MPSLAILPELSDHLYQCHRDEILLPLLEAIENYNPETRVGIQKLLTIAIIDAGITPKQLCTELAVHRASISKWSRGHHVPFKPMCHKLKAVLWRQVYNCLQPDDQLARARRAN